MKRVGIYGGSFDPIHFGHIHLACEIAEFHNLDEVWFLPTAQSPFKPTTTPIEQRMQMVQLAIKEIPHFFLIKHESEKEKIYYTIDTLRLLLSEHPDKHLHLMLGDDSVPYLSQWKEIDQLIALIPLLVGRRRCHFPVCPGSDALKHAVQRGMTPGTTLIQISSTHVRERLAHNRFCGHLIPTKVLDYIYQNQLY